MANSLEELERMNNEAMAADQGGGGQTSLPKVFITGQDTPQSQTPDNSVQPPGLPPPGQGEPGMLSAGNIDLQNRPRVQNPDGSYSTVRSISTNIDGKEVLIPTVVNGKVVSDQEAIDHYLQTGENLGTFDTPENATAYGQKVHEQQANLFGIPDKAAIDAENLQKLEALNNQAMKENGETYVAQVSDGLKTPEEQYSVMRAVTDIGAGFNNELAKTLSLPREMVDRGLALLGLDFMQHGSAQKQTIDALNRMGIPAYKVDNLANQMGRGSFEALATWAALQAAAPAMAAQQGISTAGYLMREIGKWALAHPVLGLWLGQTSNAGGKIAADSTKGSKMQPLAELGGELAGGIVGGGTAKVLDKTVGTAGRFAGRVTGEAINSISDALPPSIGNVIKQYNPLYKQPQPLPEPLYKPGLDVQDIQNYADDQVQGLKMRMQDALDTAINSVPHRGSPSVQQRVFHENLQEAERISNSLVSQAWQRVDMRNRVPMGNIRRDVVTMARDLVDTPSVTPRPFMLRVLGLASPVRDPATGRMVRAAPTIRRLRDMIAEIRTERVREQASDAPRDGYIRNLNRLQDIIERGILDAYPNNTAIMQARQASIAHHDLFSRGPMADLLAKRFRGDFRTPQNESVERLMNREELGSINGVVSGLTRNNPLGIRGASITPDERRILETMRRNAEDTIRSMYRESADQGGPQGAVRFMTRNQNAIRALANVSAELEFSVQRVQTIMQMQKDIQRSALARFSETTPEKAVARIFSDRDPASVARLLIRNFKGDPDAIEGLRNAVLAHFVEGIGKRDPLRLQQLLNSNAMSSVMREVLTSDQLSRLNKIVNTAVRVSSGEERSTSRKIMSKATFLGSIIGARLGSMVARHSGGGNIQIPGFFASAARRMVERIFAATEPSDLLINAIVDPKWEKLLYSRIPQTTKEMKAAAKKYRRLFATLDIARRHTLDQLSEDGRDLTK